MTTQTQTGEGVARPDTRTKLYWAINDNLVLIRRHLRHLTRSPEQLFTAIMLPATLLLLFRFMFGGAIDVGNTAYVNYLVPGILVNSIAMVTVSTSVAVQSDMQEGVVDRYRTIAMAESAVIIGHVVAAVFRATISLVTMVGLGIAVGFRPAGSALDWLLAVGALLLFACSLAWVAAALGLVARSADGAAGLGMIFMFDPYASSAFVQPESLPDGLRGFVEHQPVTLVVDTVRGLLLGLPVGNTGWYAAIWWVAILGVAAPVATRLYHRRYA
ncbi:ABC transporter permease [Salinispora cortesiana]|uniref:ABC transporter permease n=1 Tax=Salinispora cortesiana TaxID=1305843 RepID=UPI0004295813|nr:ABC transporter permease [Salinispora cortesiana]